MLKAIARLASSMQAKSIGQEPPSDEDGLDEMPIIVGQSAIDALPDDPHPLVGSVIDYVNILRDRGRYNSKEIPATAIALYQTDYYLAQVNNGGHSQFIHNCAANLPTTITDVLQCLSYMEAEEHLMIFTLFNEWVQSNPGELSRQTGFEGGRAERLNELDDMFYAVESDTSLREMLAEWVSTAPDLLVLPDGEVADARERLCASNPQRDKRDQIFRIVNMEAQMTRPPISAISFAAGKAQPLAPIMRMGNGTYQKIDGQDLMVVTIFTTSGRRWAALANDGVVIYDCIEHENPDMPADPLKATMDQISKWKAPEIGEELGRVRLAEVEVATRIAVETKAAAAIDLMVSKLLQPPSVDYITIRTAGPDQQGIEGMTLLLVLNNASLAMTAVVSSKGACLLSEPDHQKMVQVSRDEIDAHAAVTSLENLMT